MIPYGRQSIDEADIRAVVEVLQSDWLTQGPQVPAFETEFADSCGAAHAVAVSSATAALHLTCVAMGLRPGMRLWTSPVTFVASANAALYCGADVDFVDIDPATRNMSIADLDEKLCQARKTGELPDIVMPVHFAGHPCDMVELAELGRDYGFRILEDASHAVGSELHGARTGACRWSDAAVFSFHPVKVITTAEGGMVTTKDAKLARRIALLRSHGITREGAEMTEDPHGPWYYEQSDLGFNYRMTDMQAALGRSQLPKLSSFLDRRREIVSSYCRELDEVQAIGLPAEKNRCAFKLAFVHDCTERRRSSAQAVRASTRERDVGAGSLHPCAPSAILSTSRF